MKARRVFLITGSSGIGAETARQLASECVCFYLVGNNSSDGKALVEDLRSRGCRATFLAGDLTTPAVARVAAEQCVHQFGRIDALFNVAGISGRKFGDGPVHECTEEGWDVTLQTNATTQYRMSREVVRAMLKQPIGPSGERGVILNMSSVLAIEPDALHFSTIAYAASKGAVLAMTRSMAACYLKDRIRVNAIAPGLVRTAMSARASADPVILEYMKIRQPLIEDLIPVEDVAKTCAHLLTDASRSITGQVVSVDAGWGLV